ncbi:MAG: HEAT repeat domain-containing protein [Anaerolineae bacterium]
MASTTELVAQLESKDYNVRRMAIWELEQHGDKNHAGPIADLLTTDPSHYVRMAAARALGTFADPKTTGVLIDALNDPYYMVRQNALWSLSKLGAAAEEAMPLLQELTDDEIHYRERQLTVADVAQTALDIITLAVEEKREQEETARAAREAAAAQQVAEAGVPEAVVAAVEEVEATPREERPDKRTETIQRKKARAAKQGIDLDLWD